MEPMACISQLYIPVRPPHRPLNIPIGPPDCCPRLPRYKTRQLKLAHHCQGSREGGCRRAPPASHEQSCSGVRCNSKILVQLLVVPLLRESSACDVQLAQRLCHRKLLC